MLEMKNGIALIGGGGHCKSVINTIQRASSYDEMAVVDQAYPQFQDVLGIPVVGKDDKLPYLKSIGYDYAFITVGSVKTTVLRHKLYERAIQFGFCLPYIVDPSAQISEYAELEAGVFVGQNVVINAGAHIYKMAIINTGAIIEHECEVGEYSHIAIGAALCGNVSVGNDVLIGAGSVVIQGIRVGNRALIGAGSLVLRDVKENETVMGLVK